MLEGASVVPAQAVQLLAGLGLQRPDEIVMLFSEDHEVRRVRLNAPHRAATPSWHGDAVGHYEGDTLVIDTAGIKTDRPFAMIDLFGTPYTEKLHVTERYALVDHEAVKDALERGAKENWRPAGPVNPKRIVRRWPLRISYTSGGIRPGMSFVCDALPDAVCTEPRRE